MKNLFLSIRSSDHSATYKRCCFPAPPLDLLKVNS